MACNLNNGSLTFNANGGTAPYSYSINNGANFQAVNSFINLSAGNYQYVIKDSNNCTISGIIIVASAASPLISNVNIVPESCAGAIDGTITISTTGGTAPLQFSIDGGLTFQASNQFNNLIPGNYSIVVRDANSCTVSSNNNIINAPPAILAGSNVINAN